MKKMKMFFHTIVAKKHSTVSAMFLFIAATCSFSACSKDDDDGGEPEPDAYADSSYAKSRTVLVYMAAENSLNSHVQSDVTEMLQGIKDSTLYSDDRIVLFVDDIQKPRFYVMNKQTSETVLSGLTPVKTYDEEVNSASAEHLAEALRYAKESFPAESYGLVMWSHATGWIPSTYEGDQKTDEESKQRRSFGLDNGVNSTSANLDGHQMNIPDMARALEAAGGVDFILFDACEMQSVEVAYELRNATKAIIGSPAEIPGPGAYYGTMVKALFKKDHPAEEILQAYYDYYTKVRTDYGIIISAIETAALPSFANYMKTLVANYRTQLLSANYGSTLDYFRYGYWTMSTPDMYDAQGVMKVALSEADFEQWKQEVAKVVTCKHADSWYSAFNQRLNTIDDEQCCGMSMFLPLSKYADSRYKFNETYLDTEWGKSVWE